jgi:hypothetical protein
MVEGVRGYYGASIIGFWKKGKEKWGYANFFDFVHVEPASRFT